MSYDLSGITDVLEEIAAEGASATKGYSKHRRTGDTESSADLQHTRIYVIPDNGDLTKAHSNLTKGSIVMHKTPFKNKYSKSKTFAKKFHGEVGGIRIYDVHVKRTAVPGTRAGDGLKKAKATYEANHNGQPFAKLGYRRVVGTNGAVTFVPKMTKEQKRAKHEAKYPHLPYFPGKGATKGWHIVDKGKPNAHWATLPVGADGKPIKSKGKKSALF